MWHWKRFISHNNIRINHQSQNTFKKRTVMKSFIQPLFHKHPILGVTPLRLIFMRGLYFITFIGLAFQSWDYLVFPGEPLNYMEGIAFSFWATYATLMGIGIRYPLKMLPLLFLQLAL